MVWKQLVLRDLVLLEYIECSAAANTAEVTNFPFIQKCWCFECQIGLKPSSNILKQLLNK